MPGSDRGSERRCAAQVHDAIPPDLLRRLRICHEQACQRIRDCKPKADWSWESDKLVKTYRFQGFREAMGFLLRVSYEAEQRDHHPEIYNCYDRVTLSLNTHDAGGKVTAKDFDLARAIEAFA